MEPRRHLEHVHVDVMIILKESERTSVCFLRFNYQRNYLSTICLMKVNEARMIYGGSQ